MDAHVDYLGIYLNSNVQQCSSSFFSSRQLLTDLFFAFAGCCLSLYLIVLLLFLPPLSLFPFRLHLPLLSFPSASSCTTSSPRLPLLLPYLVLCLQHAFRFSIALLGFEQKFPDISQQQACGRVLCCSIVMSTYASFQPPRNSQYYLMH